MVRQRNYTRMMREAIDVMQYTVERITETKQKITRKGIIKYDKMHNNSNKIFV